MYTDIHLFTLIRAGWAIFVNIGRARDPDGDDGIEGDLVNTGVGLRLASSKSDRASLVSIDLVFPLTNKEGSDADSTQISVNVRKRF